MRHNEKLELWQERLSQNETAYQDELAKMDEREAYYSGEHRVDPVVENDKTESTVHLRNICAELIEAQVDSNIPAPKVTARRKKDEKLAQVIENMLRNEMDRLPVEEINDLVERIVPIQGGCGFLVEWDNEKRTHDTVGEVKLSLLHPKQIIPQDGVYTGIEDMDYIIIKLPQTKEYIHRRYGVSVDDESESEPEIRSGEQALDMVTQYVAYYRNDKGGLGKYSWVNNTELEDMEDYQARRLKRCKVCGQVQVEDVESIDPTLDGKPGRKAKRDGCKYCGGALEEAELDVEEIWSPVQTRSGMIPGAMHGEVEGEDGMIAIEMQPTTVPYYKPNLFPVTLQKNVSIYGRFLGDSDIDKVRDQQNTTSRIESKIIDKLMKSGSYITLPNEASVRVDPEDGKIIRIKNPADKTLIGVYDMQGNISQDMEYLRQVYEESRQSIGITDSFQGRVDRTATSGKAKEFAAAQSAGRLESKRVLKNAAYAAIYEAIFKFKLAYSDEPTPVVSKDIHGGTVYDEFNRYDFLEQDETGEWFYNDQFLFSCDTSSALANNREAMWQENRLNLQTGAFGDPASIDTLIMFWTKMELNHYPGASDTLDDLKEQKKQQMMMQLQQQRQAQMQQIQQRVANGDQSAMQQIDRMAQEAAMQDAQMAQDQ